MGYELFYVYLVLMIVSTALTMSQSKQVNTNMEAGKLDTPTAEEGSSIPVNFGTNIIKQSNVIWYGDSKTTEIKSKASSK
jgi:hypothetical protein